MDWTWTGIVSLALVRSGLLGRGQVASAIWQTEGLSALNIVLDRFDGEGLSLPSFDSSLTFDTVAGQARYTLGTGGDFAVRPESIVTASCTLTASPLTRTELVYMRYEDYTLIPVPVGTSGQPWNYAPNWKWPAMELFLYPTPSQVYPIILNCKVKWISTLGAPELNPFAVAAVPSGYADALVNNLALELAQSYRMETDTLVQKASASRFLLLSEVYDQHRAASRHQPVGVFPWNTGMAGRNP
jgi:hypothetical protein